MSWGIGRRTDKRFRVMAVRGSRGFTLLELLVALSIFAIVAVLAYGGLGSVLDQRIATGESAERLASLQKTYLIMQRDIEQVVPRPIRNEFGDETSVVSSEPYFQLTRGGWRNPLGNPRSTLQRVGYTLEEQQLIRHSWLVLDRAQDSEPRRQVLATGINSIQVRFLDTDNNWHDQWPTVSPKTSQDVKFEDLPRAIEIVLQHEHYGKIRWLFQLPA